MRIATPPPPAARWYLLDAGGQPLGRLAARIAHLLRGKHRPTWSPHLPAPDHVVVVNVGRVSLGKTALQSKVYRRHTGTIGHLREERAADVLARSPEKLLQSAVRGMLPASRLRSVALRRLHVYRGGEHPHCSQTFHPLPPR